MVRNSTGTHSRPRSSMGTTLILLSFVIGAGICAQLPGFISYWLIVLIILGGVCCCFLRAVRFAGYALVALGLGLLISTYHLGDITQSQLASDFENVDLVIRLQVDALPESNQDVVRFTGTVKSLHNTVSAGSDLGGKRIRLAWYKTPKYRSHRNKNIATLFDNIAPGQLLQLHVRLKRPRGLVNPGGFDYHAWLLSQKIVATGYVRDAPSPVLIAQTSAWTVASLRYYLKRVLFSHDTPYQHTGLLQALLLGDKSQISSSQWQVLQQTGTIHLMAISGLHVGLVAVIAYCIAGFVVGMLALAGARNGLFFLAPMFAILAAFVYSGLAGFSVPTQRALIMVVLVNIAILLQWRLSPILLLSIAAAFVCIIDPFVFLQPGFWLSFGAVFFLLYSLSGRGKSTRYHQFLSAQYAITVGLLLPMLLFTLPISLYAPLANFIAIPVVSMLVIPPILLAATLSLFSPLLASYVLTFSDVIINYLWSLLLWIASLDGTYWLAPPSSIVAIILAILASLLLLAPRGLALRPLGAVLMFTFVVSSLPTQQKAKKYRLTVLDVGQGLALVFSTPTTTWLYDTGAKISDTFDMGSRVVVPFLRYRGIYKLDGLVVSHSDNDHSGGVSAVLSNFFIPKLIAGQPEKMVTIDHPFTQCHVGQHWTIDAADIHILWPTTTEKNISDNDTSCVLLIHIGDTKVLIPGDISAKVERQILALPQLQNGVDVVIAPHHGSNTSSSADFVKRLSPRYVIYSHGYKSRYGHPHKKVTARYDSINAISFSTADDGAIEMEWDEHGNELTLNAQRQRERRLWY